MPLPLDAIDEDPAQPRHEFDANGLLELAATMRERGVRQPISVRPNLRHAGRWVLNFGARRLRAAKLAGLTEIPAFIDTTAETRLNVERQREGLTPSNWPCRAEATATGDSTAVFAQARQSRPYIHRRNRAIERLLGCSVYRGGRCRGKQTNELRRLQGDTRNHVEAGMGDGHIQREQTSRFGTTVPTFVRHDRSTSSPRQPAKTGSVATQAQAARPSLCGVRLTCTVVGPSAPSVQQAVAR